MAPVNVAVFEGFFNFLSYRTMFLNQEEPIRNFLVLKYRLIFFKINPQKCWNMSVFICTWTMIKPDKNAPSMLLLWTVKNSRMNESCMQKYNDLNDWLMQYWPVAKTAVKAKALIFLLGMQYADD